MTMERPHSVPEHIANPEYWDGHNYQDNCEWLVGNVTDYKGFQKAFRENQKAKEPFLRSSVKYIEDFAEIGQGESVNLHRYTEGQTFDANLHEPGTIVRETTQFPEHVVDPSVTYGVVCDTKIGQELIRVIAIWHITPNGETMFIGVEEPIVRIGPTRHDRYRNNVMMGETQFISKIVSVETVLPGRGSPRRSTNASRKPGILKRSIPQPL